MAALIKPYTRKSTDRRKLPAAIVKARDITPGDMSRQWLDNPGDACLKLTPERAEVILVNDQATLLIRR
jgi:hypothetical protein